MELQQAIETVQLSEAKQAMLSLFYDVLRCVAFCPNTPAVLSMAVDVNHPVLTRSNQIFCLCCFHLFLIVIFFALIAGLLGPSVASRRLRLSLVGLASAAAAGALDASLDGTGLGCTDCPAHRAGSV